MIYFLVIIAMYGYAVFSLMRKHNTHILISFITYNVFYDWAFISIDGTLYADIGSNLKIVYELIVLTIFFFCPTKNNLYGFKYFVFALLYGLCISFITILDVGNIIKSFRMFFEPILVGYILYSKGLLANLNYRQLYNYFCLLTCIMCAYSIYQRNNYTSVQDIWFYDYFNKISEKPLDSSSYNYFRENTLRCPSFLTSSISSSIFFAYMFLHFMIVKAKRISVLMMLVALLGILLSNTRIGYIIVIIGLTVYIWRHRRLGFIISIPIGATILTFAVLSFELYSEESALGRLMQYRMVLSNFSILGKGFSDSMSVLFYDSYFLSLFHSIGIVFLSFAAFFYKQLTIRKKYLSCKNDYYIFTFVLTVVSTYTIFFHFYAGDASYKVYALLFIGISSTYRKRKPSIR